MERSNTETRKQNAAGKAGINITVFLVDDNVAYLRALEDEFKEHSNYRVHTFTSADECVGAIDKLNPDLIVTDYHLERNNIESPKTGSWVKKQAEKINKNIQVIIISGDEKVELMKQIPNLKPEHFLEKKGNILFPILSVAQDVWYKKQKWQSLFRIMLIIIFITIISFSLIAIIAKKL